MAYTRKGSWISEKLLSELPMEFWDYQEIRYSRYPEYGAYSDEELEEIITKYNSAAISAGFPQSCVEVITEDERIRRMRLEKEKRQKEIKERRRIRYAHKKE